MLMCFIYAFDSDFSARLDAVGNSLMRPGRHVLDRGQRFLVRIPQGQQRIEHVCLGVVPHGAADRADVGAQLALQFQQQALGGLLADARHLDQAPGFLQRHGLGQVGHRHAGQDRQRGAGADAGDLDQLAEHGALVGGAEAEQQVGIFAHHVVREQHDFSPVCGRL
jgi:hypothetical protein